MRNVGLLRIDVINRSTPDYDQFHCELAEEDYAKCGLRPFTGSGSFDHIYSDGNTKEEAVRDMVDTLRQCGLTGTLRIR